MAIQAYPFPVFQPAMRVISSITNGFPAVVTTTFDHQYISGTVMRLYVPVGYGMVQANQLTGEIVVTGTTTFAIGIDSTLFNPFTTPSTFPENTQYPQCVPFAENSATLKAATQNVLPYSAT